MPKNTITARKPLRQKRIGNTTLSLQRIDKPPYSFLCSMRRQGQRVSEKYFKIKLQAEQLFQKWEVECTNHGTQHDSISSSEHAAIVKFREAIAKIPDPKPTLDECVTSFLETIKRNLKPITVNELINLRVKQLETKQRHERTIRDLVGADRKGGRLGAFARTFGERQASTISSEEIESWSHQHCSTEATRREVLIRINGLFSAGKKYLVKNPVEEINIPPPNAPRAHILTPEESLRLLSFVHPRSLPAVVFQLFGGLRKAECSRLKWEHVDFNRLTIHAIQRKGTGRKREKDRYVTLNATLLAWLDPHRKQEGFVFPTGKSAKQPSETIYKKDFAAARANAKIDWEENTLRHCFGTYLYALTSDINTCMAQMGHTEKDTFMEYYRKGVPKATGEEFWALRPLAKTQCN